MPDEETRSTAVMEPPVPPPPAAPPTTAEAEPPRRMPWWQRILVTLFVAFLLLILLGALAYNFGSMWPASPAVQAEYDQLVASGQVRPVEDRQFHIPIPGCVCHSDDPVLTVEHEDRRIRECSSCHGGR